MDITISSLISGARKAKGLTVIIDVFRAATTASVILNNKADAIIPIGNISEAFSLKRKNPAYILVAERDFLQVEGSDFGNSPFKIQNTDFSNKLVIMTTSAGTQGIANASSADEILLAGFTNAQATISYIKKKNPKFVTLVPIGTNGIEIADEDELCARYIKDSLEEKKPNFIQIKNYLLNYKTAQKFLENRTETPRGDLDICLSLNIFNFIMKVVKNKGVTEIVKEEIKINNKLPT